MFPIGMAVNPRSGMDCGKVIAEALSAEQMTQKEAWIGGGWTDGAQFSRAIKGEQPMDLHKLAAIPSPSFQFEWTARYLSEFVRAWARNLLADRLRMVRAELPDTNRRKVGA